MTREELEAAQDKRWQRAAERWTEYTYLRRRLEEGGIGIDVSLVREGVKTTWTCSREGCNCPDYRMRMEPAGGVCKHWHMVHLARTAHGAPLPLGVEWAPTVAPVAAAEVASLPAAAVEEPIVHAVPATPGAVWRYRQIDEDRWVMGQRV